MVHRSSAAIVFVVAIALVLAGCAAPTPTPAPATAVAEAAAAVKDAKSEFALAGTEWQLESMLGARVVEGTDPTLGFGVDRYSGFGGCDWFQGMYTAKGDTLTLQVPATTRGGCVTQPQATEQQSSYLAALRNVTDYAIEDGKLILYTTDKQRMATMVPLQELPFEGTTWELYFYFMTDGAYWAPALPGAQVTVKFDGKMLSGNAGCNDYQATYRQVENRLELDKLSVTMKTCALPDGVMEQESAYLSMLGTVGAFDKFPRSLELLASDGIPLLAYHAQVQGAK